MFKLIVILGASFLLAGCSIQNQMASEENVVVREESPAPSTSPAETYTPNSEIEEFLVNLTKDTQLQFYTPAKADIFWNEGESSSTLKTFYGDSFLVIKNGATLTEEKIVSEYLTGQGFEKMKFNGSIGDDSQKMGYRKGDVICKTDYGMYPEETSQHLAVYCSDATKGKLRD